MWKLVPASVRPYSVAECNKRARTPPADGGSLPASRRPFATRFIPLSRHLRAQTSSQPHGAGRAAQRESIKHHLHRHYHSRMFYYIPQGESCLFLCKFTNDLALFATQFELDAAGSRWLFTTDR